QEDVFPPRKVLMKPRAHFYESGQAAIYDHPALGGLHDAAQDFQRRAFSCSVMTDNTEGLASPYFKRDVLKGPEFTLVFSADLLLPEHFSGHGRNQIAQRVKNLAFAKFLINLVHLKGDVRHVFYRQILSANAGSRYLKKT